MYGIHVVTTRVIMKNVATMTFLTAIGLKQNIGFLRFTKIHMANEKNESALSFQIYSLTVIFVGMKFTPKHLKQKPLIWNTN